MKVTVTHRRDKKRPDYWAAESPDLPLPGVGRTWGEAVEALVRANMAEFGVTELETVDPFHKTGSLRYTEWRAHA